MVPTCMEPSWIRNAPNQITATDETFSTSITVGNASAISRPARRAVSVTSSLARAKRAVSTSSRTNARTTRMPVSCSRSTRFTVSIRVCMSRNSGTIRVMISPTPASSTGTLTAISQDSCRSCRMAMITPPMHSMGAATISVAETSTSCWTCWTSLVERVMRLGAPKRVTSCSENAATRLKIAPRTSRPIAIAAFAPKYTATMAQAICSRVTSSITRADAQDVLRVPLRHALVDDVRVQGGQVQRGDGLRQLEDDDGEQQPALRRQVFNEQFPEHPVSQPRVPPSDRRSVYVRRPGEGRVPLRAERGAFGGRCIRGRSPRCGARRRRQRVQPEARMVEATLARRRSQRSERSVHLRTRGWLAGRADTHRGVFGMARVVKSANGRKNRTRA